MEGLGTTEIDCGKTDRWLGREQGEPLLAQKKDYGCPVTTVPGSGHMSTCQRAGALSAQPVSHGS